MLKQISIFAENKKGIMKDITDILKENNVNIWGSVINEGTEFGVVHMIVSDTDKALKALKEGDYLCRVTDVIGAEMVDEVGSLNKVLTVLDESNINVNYIYLSFNRESGRPVQVFYAEDIWEVENCLKMKGIRVI